MDVVRLGGELQEFFKRTGRPRRAVQHGQSSTIRIPEHIDWDIHRIAISERYKSSLIEIETLWSLDDLLDAHDILDVIERAEAEQRMQAEALRGSR